MSFRQNDWFVFAAAPQPGDCGADLHIARITGNYLPIRGRKSRLTPGWSSGSRLVGASVTVAVVVEDAVKV